MKTSYLANQIQANEKSTLVGLGMIDLIRIIAVYHFLPVFIGEFEIKYTFVQQSG